MKLLTKIQRIIKCENYGCLGRCERCEEVFDWWRSRSVVSVGEPKRVIGSRNHSAELINCKICEKQIIAYGNRQYALCSNCRSRRKLKGEDIEQYKRHRVA